MKAIKQLVAAGFLLVAVADTASATPVTWSDIIPFSPPVLISGGNVYGGPSLAGEIMLNQHGEFTVTIFSLARYFYIGGSTWTVHGDSGSGSAARRVSVPEPSTLALLGLGLLAVSFATRRKKTS